MTKRALVTGATGAIGPSICRRLARAGLHVIVHGNKRTDAAERLAREITAAGGAAETTAFDVTDADAAALTEGRAGAPGGATAVGEASQQLVPDGGERHQRRTGVDAVLPQQDAAALAAELGGGLEQGHAVARLREQRGGGEPADPAADHDDAAHGVPPSTIETMSSTPVNDPAM